MFKKLMLLMCMIFTLAIPSYAENLIVPEELSSYGDNIYTQARSFHGRSFDGYCGTYVRCQLRAMGIFDNKFDFRGNGNQWYSNFENVQMTSGGYYVYREPGENCLVEIAEKYGNNLENIVLSFPVQSGYSAENPGAGHALVIYRLQDGVAYYTESFSFGKNREGQVIAEDAEELVKRYSRRHGSPIGCVLLSKEPKSGVGFVIDNLYDVGGSNLVFSKIEKSMEEITSLTFAAEKLTEVYA